MDTTAEFVTAPAKVKRPRNWWKIGFFVMLIAFEIARELAVVGFSQTAQPNNFFFLNRVGTLVSAEGSWKRIDGGDKLMPAAVKIECWQDRGICIEAVANASELNFYAPTLDWFDATFTDDAVSYENDLPDCAKYSVRMDLKQKKVFAVRDRKENPANPACTKLEPRIEMTLGNGWEYKNPADGHFVPIISLFGYLINKL